VNLIFFNDKKCNVDWFSGIVKQERKQQIKVEQLRME